MTYLTYALSLPVENKPQTTFFRPVLSSAAASVFFQPCLKPAVPISNSGSLIRVFLGRLLILWLCDVHCSLASCFHLFAVCIQANFLLFIASTVGFRSVSTHKPLLLILSGQCKAR